MSTVFPKYGSSARHFCAMFLQLLLLPIVGVRRHPFSPSLPDEAGVPPGAEDMSVLSASAVTSAPPAPCAEPDAVCAPPPAQGLSFRCARGLCSIAFSIPTSETWVYICVVFSCSCPKMSFSTLMSTSPDWYISVAAVWRSLCVE